MAGGVRSFMTHVCRPFVERARLRPDDIFAIVVKQGTESTLTNRAVLAHALAIGRDLRDRGVAVGDLVAIVLEHRDDLYPAFLGCMIRGLVPAFLPPLTVKQDPDIFRRSMATLFARIRPAAVLTSASSREHVPQGTYAILEVEDVGASVCDDAADVAGRLLDDLGDTSQATAFLQHSSGTTGLKKGVMLSHRTVIEHVRRYAGAIGAAPEDVVASWLPLYHDMGLITSFLLPAVVGCTIASLDALEWVVRPTMLLDCMERTRAAFTHLPDFAFHHLLRAARGARRWDLTAVKAVINCSEPCRAVTFERFAERFADMGIGPAKLLVCYAMAENVFAVSQTPPEAVARHGGTAATSAFLSCGRALPGVEIAIRDRDGRPAAAGVPGEICLRSTTLFQGYFRQPDATAASLRDGWFHTRDLGCIETGELFVLGRVDDLLIVNGRNVFAHEIEDVVNGVAGVAPGRALACTDFSPQAGAVRLLIVCEPASDDVVPATLQAGIRQVVLDHTGMFPGAVHLVARGFLVKSSSGKIARAESFRKFRLHVADRPA